MESCSCFVGALITCGIRMVKALLALCIIETWGKRLQDEMQSALVEEEGERRVRREKEKKKGRKEKRQSEGRKKRLLQG